MNKATLMILTVLILSIFATPILAYGGGGGGSSSYSLPKDLKNIYEKDYNIIAKELKQSFYAGSLLANQIKKFTINNKNKMAVTSLEVWNKEKASNLGIAVIITNTEQGNIYQEFDIIHNLKSINSATVYFKVEKQWQNSFDDLTIEHVGDSGEITSIKPDFIKEDKIYSFYKFVTPSFSTFRIIGTKEIVQEVVEEIIPEPKAIEQTTSQETVPTPAEKTNKGLGWLVSLIIVIVLVVGYFLLKKKK